MFFRQGLKSLPGTNTLAYYKNSQIMDVKSFITLAPGQRRQGPGTACRHRPGHSGPEGPGSSSHWRGPKRSHRHTL